MTDPENFQRLSDAVDRLIVRLKSLRSQRDKLVEKVDDLQSRLENSVDGVDSDGYNILRIHSARLLQERQELKRRLVGVLEKLESIEI